MTRLNGRLHKVEQQLNELQRRQIELDSDKIVALVKSGAYTFEQLEKMTDSELWALVDSV